MIQWLPLGGQAVSKKSQKQTKVKKKKVTTKLFQKEQKQQFKDNGTVYKNELENLITGNILTKS